MASAHLFLISLGEEELLRVRSSAALGSWVLFSLYGYLPHRVFRVFKVWVTFCNFSLVFLYIVFFALFCINFYFVLFFVLYCSILWPGVWLLQGYFCWFSVRCLCTLRYSSSIVLSLRHVPDSTCSWMMNTAGSYRSSHPLS